MNCFFLCLGNSGMFLVANLSNAGAFRCLWRVRVAHLVTGWGAILCLVNVAPFIKRFLDGLMDNMIVKTSFFGADG